MLTLSLLLSLLPSLLTSSAAAQPTDPEHTEPGHCRGKPAAWCDLATEGLAAVDSSDWPEVRRLFTAAHDILPLANNLRYVALADLRLGEPLEAHRQLMRAFAIEGDFAFTHRARAGAEQLRAEIRERIGRLEIDAEGGANTTVDGQGTNARTVWVSPGEHVVRVEGDGRHAEQLVTVGAGRVSEVRLRVPPPPGAVAADPAVPSSAASSQHDSPSDSPPADTSMPGDAIAAWVGTGVFGATTIGMVLWQRDRDGALGTCEFGDAPCTSDTNDAIQQEMETALAFSGAFAGLTAGALGAALTLTLSESSGVGRGAPLLIAGGVTLVGSIITGLVMKGRNDAIDECGASCEEENLAAIRNERNAMMFTSLMFAGATASLVGYGVAALFDSEDAAESATVRCAVGVGDLTCWGRF